VTDSPSLSEESICNLIALGLSQMTPALLAEILEFVSVPQAPLATAQTPGRVAAQPDRETQGWRGRRKGASQ
jgi:hypothetical protein